MAPPTAPRRAAGPRVTATGTEASGARTTNRLTWWPRIARPSMIGPMETAANVFAWAVAGGAWAVILGLPVALVVPRSRRWLLKPVTRRLKARKARALEARALAWEMAQARRDARTAVLEHELSQLDAF